MEYATALAVCGDVAAARAIFRTLPRSSTETSRTRMLALVDGRHAEAGELFDEIVATLASEMELQDVVAVLLERVVDYDDREAQRARAVAALTVATLGQ